MQQTKCLFSKGLLLYFNLKSNILHFQAWIAVSLNKVVVAAALAPFDADVAPADGGLAAFVRAAFLTSSAFKMSTTA